MKKIILHFVLPFCAIFAGACNSDSAAITAETMDSLAAHQTPNVVPTPANNSPYQPLTKSIHVGLLTEAQTVFFQQFITPKQTSFEQAEKGQSHRMDTLYGVSYLPYKDQELYLYQAVFNKTTGSGHNYWCVSIAKEGSLLVDEQIISEEKYASMVLKPMKNGDKTLEFVATKLDGTTEAISLEYDGKKLKK